MFLAISDFYFPGSITLIIILVITVVRHLRTKEEQTEVVAYHEDIRKKELTRLVETRGVRETEEKFSEERFWKMVEEATSRAKDGYSFQLGVLRDVLSNLSNEELIELDNLYYSLIRENINHHLTATTAIIFGDGSAGAAVLLMNVFMMKGELFFKNACQNPNLIIGKSLVALEGRTIEDLVEDLYFKKTRTLIPLRPEKYQEEFKIPGEPWKQQELPSKYRELWEAFA